jgi:hypothetical protein
MKAINLARKQTTSELCLSIFGVACWIFSISIFLIHLPNAINDLLNFVATLSVITLISFLLWSQFTLDIFLPVETRIESEAIYGLVSGKLMSFNSSQIINAGERGSRHLPRHVFVVAIDSSGRKVKFRFRPAENFRDLCEASLIGQKLYALVSKNV